MIKKATSNRRGPKYKYPWPSWFDGKLHLLKQGKQFKCALATFRVAAYRVATNWKDQYGRKLKVCLKTVSPTQISIQASFISRKREV